LEANIQQEICIIPRQKFHRVSRNIFLKMWGCREAEA
jgi:hypothetical protein